MTAPASPVTRVVVVLTTLAADVDAAAFARTLVEERLAACVNVMPEMRSIYRWEGAVQSDAERSLVIKTVGEMVPRLWTRIRELHSYDVPEFLVLPVSEGSQAYLDWVARETEVNGSDRT